MTLALGDAAPGADLAVIDSPGLPTVGRVSQLPVEVMNAGLAQFVDRRKSFRGWLLAQLEAGVHFGVPPGCEPKLNANGELMMKVRGDFRAVRKDQWRPKPVLYQAGAQMLCEMLRLRPVWESDESAWRMLGSVPGLYVARCRLIYLGGPIPFFDDEMIGKVVGESIGAVEPNEKGHPANTAVKIADKRSMVGAVVNALSMSDLFTQDLDNMSPPGEPPDQRPDAPKVAPRGERQAAKPTDPALREAIGKAFTAYKAVIGGTWDDFAGYAAGVAQTPAPLAAPSDWSIDTAERVLRAINVEAEQ